MNKSWVRQSISIVSRLKDSTKLRLSERLRLRLKDRLLVRYGCPIGYLVGWLVARTYKKIIVVELAFGLG